MKRIILITLMIAFGVSLYAQTENKIPNVSVKNLKRQRIEYKDILKHNGVVVVAFWATWCKPCINELTAINDVYADWQEETNVKLVAVSIDDARFFSKVKMFVKSKDWEFETFTDENQDLKRKLNVNSIPHLVMYDKNKKIVWEHTSYVQGAEKELYKVIKKYSNED